MYLCIVERTFIDGVRDWPNSGDLIGEGDLIGDPIPPAGHDQGRSWHSERLAFCQSVCARTCCLRCFFCIRLCRNAMSTRKVIFVSVHEGNDPAGDEGVWRGMLAGDNRDGS